MVLENTHDIRDGIVRDGVTLMNQTLEDTAGKDTGVLWDSQPLVVNAGSFLPLFKGGTSDNRILIGLRLDTGEFIVDGDVTYRKEYVLRTSKNTATKNNPVPSLTSSWYFEARYLACDDEGNILPEARTSAVNTSTRGIGMRTYAQVKFGPLRGSEFGRSEYVESAYEQGNCRSRNLSIYQPGKGLVSVDQRTILSDR